MQKVIYKYNKYSYTRFFRDNIIHSKYYVHQCDIIYKSDFVNCGAKYNIRSNNKEYGKMTVSMLLYNSILIPLFTGKVYIGNQKRILYMYCSTAYIFNFLSFFNHYNKINYFKFFYIHNFTTTYNLIEYTSMYCITYCKLYSTYDNFLDTIENNLLNTLSFT